MPKIRFTPVKLFSRQNVVTASRSIGTVFKNTTGRPILVVVTCTVVGSGVTGVGRLLTDSSNPPTTVLSEMNNDSVTNMRLQLKCMVIPNNFYRAIQLQGIVTLINWTEWS